MNFELPSRQVFMETNKANFELAKRLGFIKDLNWEQHADLLKREYDHMASMDPQKRKEFIMQRHAQNKPAYEALRGHLEKMENAARLRKIVGNDANELKKYKKGKK